MKKVDNYDFIYGSSTIWSKQIEFNESTKNIFTTHRALYRGIIRNIMHVAHACDVDNKIVTW